MTILQQINSYNIYGIISIQKKILKFYTAVSSMDS